MAALREGRTVRLFGAIAPRLQAYYPTVVPQEARRRIR